MAQASFEPRHLSIPSLTLLPLRRNSRADGLYLWYILIGPVSLAQHKDVWMDPDVDYVNRTIDGNNDPNFQHGSCVETPGTKDFEWWTVDLLWNHIIQRLRVVAGWFSDSFILMVHFFGSTEL